MLVLLCKYHISSLRSSFSQDVSKITDFTLMHVFTQLHLQVSPKNNMRVLFPTLQIEENTRVLEKLGQRIGTSVGSSEDDGRSCATPGASSVVTPKSGRASVQEKWKVGAKKALLQWCQGQITDKFGIAVRDFGKSWRDGNAFLGIVNSIKPGRSARDLKLSSWHLLTILINLLGVEVETTVYTGKLIRCCSS
jgi:hypothetical protein